MTATVSKTVQITRYGGAEVLELVERAVGQPAAGEILLRHHAIGLNFIDVYQRSGLYALPLPLALGMEGAGVVEAVGDGVTHLQKGDRVAYASNPPGSYCERRVMPATHVCKLPDHISFETGAAMMLKGLTVQYLLKQCIPVEGLQAGDHVLFHAAAGGVGLIACQWAKALGAKLIGTVGSAEKAQRALQAGAWQVINYRDENIAERVKAITGGKKLPVVYDSVGKDTWEASLDCLQRRGLMVSFGNSSGPVTGVNLGILNQKGSLFVTRPSLNGYITTYDELKEASHELFSLIASGIIKVDVAASQKYPLKEARRAHEILESRATQGSSLLIP